jgi:hypothetical protein
MSWAPPDFLGGCIIEQYTLLRDDGAVSHVDGGVSDVNTPITTTDAHTF